MSAPSPSLTIQSTPLATKKLVVMPLSPSTPSASLSLKRPGNSSPDAPTKKPRPSTRHVTDGEGLFKVPQIPTRALTPSTSTVAYPSSPRPALSSSPVRAPIPTRMVPPRKKITANEQRQDVQIGPGAALVFGRHRHQPTGMTTSTETQLGTCLPVHLQHLVANLDTCAQVVHLSRNASHASRVHAVVEHLENDMVRIVVVGQNGLKLDGRRMLQGQRVDVPRGDLGLIGIDFHGASVRVSFPEMEEREGRLFTPPPNTVEEPLTPGTSLPPSSPPIAPDLASSPAVMPTRLDEDRASSPLSGVSGDEGGEEGGEEGEGLGDMIGKEVKAEMMETIDQRLLPQAQLPQPQQQPPQQRPTAQTLPARVPRPVPDGIDLAALLASTVVFSGSSKLSLPDLVKHMLESQPSLKIHGEEDVWHEWCSETLEGDPMFGKVQRHGKDSSGHPLLPHYFYNPDLDSDKSRAKELGGLVRPLRTVQRGGGKAIDWRPVGSGRRRY